MYDVVDVQGVTPDGVLSDIGFARRYDDVVVEGQFLALLFERVVAVGILQRKDAVLSLGQAFDGKMSLAVGARHPKERLRLKGAVGQIVIQSHENAFDRLHVRCLDNVSGDFQGVNLSARGETVGKISQRVSLVVVTDGVAEIDGVGGVGLERVLQFHDDALACRLDFRHFHLWG